MCKDIIISMQKEFIERCSAARKALKYTLKDVANDLECSHENIRKFENGKNNSLIIACYYMYMFDVEV